MIAAQAEDHGCTRSKIWKHVHATEKSRNLAWMVKYTLGMQAHRKGLTQVTAATSGSQPEITYTKKTEVKQACLAEAGKCFTQANRTLFLHGQLLKDFGEIGVDQPAFKEVLAGTYVPLPGCEPLTIKLLQALQQTRLQNMPKKAFPVHE